MRLARIALSPLTLAALLLAGCASTPINRPVEVLRYHLGENQVPRGTVALEAAVPGAETVDWRAYADAVAAELARNGYTVAPLGAPAPGTRYVATVNPQRGTREALDQGPSFSLGLGGGSFGRGGGVGGGVGVPIGGNKVREIVGTGLSVKIAERGATGPNVIWEGRAMTEADARLPDAAPEAAARKLAYALFQGFPGESGRTITVK